MDKMATLGTLSTIFCPHELKFEGNISLDTWDKSWSCFKNQDLEFYRLFETAVKRSISALFPVRHLPHILVVVMYLEPLFSFVEWSYQLSTSRTACGFFFCSCLLMLEDMRSFAHCSGIP